MAKIFLMALLLVVSATAMAAWVSLGGNESETRYVDSATTRTIGTESVIWNLRDTAKPVVAVGTQYLSSKEQWEYDCVAPRARLLYVITYSDHMGRGEVVSDAISPIAEWQLLNPKGVHAILRKHACGNR